MGRAPDNLSPWRTISGRVFPVGDDVGAEAIIAPEYLTFDLDDAAERRWLGAYSFASLAETAGEFVPVGEFRSPYAIVVAGRRFGHGSARIHSAVALAEAGVRCVVADTFASGFLRAATNAGLLLCLTFERPRAGRLLGRGAEAQIDLAAPALVAGSERVALTPPGAVLEIVEAGGLAALLAGRRPIDSSGRR